MATDVGFKPVGKDTFDAKLRVPALPVFLNTVKVALSTVIKSGFPSPSISHILTSVGVFPVGKSTFASKSAGVILPLLGLNMGLKNLLLLAAKVVTELSTVIGAKVAPVGTITDKLVADAVVTIAFVAPKNTMLFAVVVLNPLPVIVTNNPTAPFAGLKDEMLGACAFSFIFIKEINKINIATPIFMLVSIVIFFMVLIIYLISL